MAGFDGSGNWIPRYSFVVDAANGVKILASRQDAMWNDVAAGFGNCITRDGQGKPSADIDMNGKQLLNLGWAIDPLNALSLQQAQSMAGGGGVNPVVNPTFTVWQRGSITSVGAAGGYTADHWYLRRSDGTGSTNCAQQAGDAGNPFFTSIKVSRALGDTNTAFISLRSVIESVEARKLTGFQNNVTGACAILTVYLKVGTTVNPSDTINLRLYSNATSDAKPWNAGWAVEGQQGFSASSFNTTTYTRVGILLNAHFSNTACLMIEVEHQNFKATAGADDTVYVTGVKYEQQVSAADATNATPLVPNNYTEDLNRCKRYYQVIGDGGGSNNITVSSYDAAGATNDHYIRLGIDMFAVPVTATVGTWALRSNCAVPSIVAHGNDGVFLRTVVTALGHFSYASNAVNEYFTLEAELTA